MVTTFEAHLGEMNQIVAASQARARATPPPAPPSPDSQLFVRISADWSRDTDGDGTPDWVEEAVAADSNHPQQSLANTFSSDTDQDGTLDGSQLDFDGDGNPDMLDASIADPAVYWNKGPVPRYAVSPGPAPYKVTGAIDRNHFWGHPSDEDEGTTIFTHLTGTRTFEQTIQSVVPLPSGGFAAFGETLLINNPASPGVWTESEDLSTATQLCAQGWAALPRGSNGVSSGSPTNSDGIWANGEAVPFNIAAPGLSSTWAGDYEFVEMSRHGSLLVKTGGNGATEEHAIAVPILIEDDEIATGVDNVSITSTKPGPEVDNKQWIMAPAGAATNSVIFKTNATAINPIGLEAPTAEFDPGSLNATQVTIEVNAPQGSNTSEEDLNIKLGDKESITSPVGIKVMKRRTINVKVWKIGSVEPSSNPDDSRDYAPLNIPSENEIESYLNEIYERQLNADIKITMSPAVEDAYHHVEWDITDPYDYGESIPPR